MMPNTEEEEFTFETRVNCCDQKNVKLFLSDFNESMFHSVLNDLVASKLLNGHVQGHNLWVPALFASTQTASVDRFYLQNM